ncbi:sigma-E processing peptidase SpoIIGA [Bacillus smithii]|uniref:sigma-E processing peptidase SpoIIGA n=1 Tax=Bacillus smithii TaxID=1479 RepID=UPI002E1D2CED|nr:sigma-E processing peptidase SpoIIGA [Bacillus smithii]
MVVYLDVIWLLNLLVDSLLLWMTALFLKRQVSFFRILLGGIIGSCLVLLLATKFAPIAGNPAVKVLFSIWMVLAVFGYKRFRFFLSNLLTLYFATFLLGGILIGIHYFISFDSNLHSATLLANVKGFGDPISWVFVMLAIPVAWYFSKRRLEDFETAKIQYDQLVDVMIHFAGCQLELKGLVDSGNHLFDPLTKTPVMIVSTKGLENTLPREILEIAEEPDKFLNGELELNQKWADRVHFIPAQSVGKTRQLLLAFKSDGVKIQNQPRGTVSKALIHFTVQQLSADQSFACIVHPKLAATAPKESAS